MQRQAGALRQGEGTARDRVFQRRPQVTRGHLNNRAAMGAYRVVVRDGGHSIGGNPVIEGQSVQHPLVDQGGHGAVDGRQVGWLGIGGQGCAQPLVDLGYREVPVDWLKHRQHLDPRRHPP